MELSDIVEYLKSYDGPKLRLMEVCGSHTQAISKFGIRELLSDNIQLISGPGCPVCVTPTDYIDKLVELSCTPGTTVVTFGDLLRVPGSKSSLNEAKGAGGKSIMVYSPMDILKLAQDNPGENYVFAAVGFETTAPVYTILLDQIIACKIKNVKLLTALKTMPGAIDFLLENGAEIDGFIAPGHVCAITGADYFSGLAEKYHMPFAVSGFSDKELLLAIYGLAKMARESQAGVKNFYTSVVESERNETAYAKINQYFEPADVAWRGMGVIKDSGLLLKKEYLEYDAGSIGLDKDNKRNKGCRCGDILMGKAKPEDCPLFGRACNPMNPQGACMVSLEGSCFTAYSCK